MQTATKQFSGLRVRPEIGDLLGTSQRRGDHKVECASAEDFSIALRRFMKDEITIEEFEQIQRLFAYDYLAMARDVVRQEIWHSQNCACTSVINRSSFWQRLMQFLGRSPQFTW